MSVELTDQLQTKDQIIHRHNNAITSDSLSPSLNDTLAHVNDVAVSQDSPYPQEVVQKLSSITEELTRMEEQPSESISSQVDTTLKEKFFSMEGVTNTPPGVQRPEPFIVLPNTVVTPVQFKSHISLRGRVIISNQSSSNLFEEMKSKKGQIGTEIGIWEGFWGMNDTAFIEPNGLTSPFAYSVKIGQDLLSGDDENSVTVVVTGMFKVKSALEPVEVEEKDVVLKVEKKEGKSLVSGSGQNKYGVFNLTGFYSESNNELNCYREYQKAGTQPKPRKMKRKSPAVKPPATKKSKSSPALEQDLLKRERKTPVKLKESLNMKTLKPKKESNSTLGSKSDMEAIHDMVEKLIETDKEGFFSTPVDTVKLQLVDYHDIVKRPMDLGTVLSNLKEGKYDDIYETSMDIKLVFHNAMLYNPKKHPVHSIAAMHLKLFEKDLKCFQKEKEKAERLMHKRTEQKIRARTIKPGNPQQRVDDMKKLFAEKQQQLNKDKKKILEMFSSSDSDASSDSDDEELVRPPVAKPEEPAKKKKKKKPAKDDIMIMRKTMAMMNSQLEMMQQMQNNSLDEITRLNSELNETKKQAFPQMQAASRSQLMQASGMLPAAYANMNPYGMPAPPMLSATGQATSFPDKQGAKKDKPLDFHEMKQLGNDINTLPAGDVEDMVKLLRDHGADLGDGEEFELDLENLAPTIQRKLQRFASKKLAKAKSTASIGDLRFDES